MKRLLYVDHSHHRLTRSTVFLRELLEQHFVVDILWDDSWKRGAEIGAEPLDAGGHDLILFFQVLPHGRTLRRLRCRDIVWVPMRDQLRYEATRLRRLRTSPLKIVNFCAEAQAWFERAGQRSLGVQYWPEPGPRPAAVPARERPRLFFWPRRREIGWHTLKDLLGDFRPEGIVLRHAPDPGQDFPLPSEADVREYRIQVVQGWLEQADYHRLLAGCDIFVAPRPLEGIGQALLEAMRRGMSVIAPDAPTMNEYVKDGVTGWLYPPTAPQPLDFSGWAARGTAAYDAVARGHAQWLGQRERLVQFIAQPPPRARWQWQLRRLTGF
jgi:hypothetical protein